MRSILIEHNQRYPHWTVQDLYKLVHQAALGSEHALRDEVRVRAWLMQELDQLGPGPYEPLLDPISPDDLVVRVHLRPFARLRLDGEALLEAFIHTAREFSPSISQLSEYCAAAIELARDGTLPFEAGRVSALFAEMQAASFPAVHHSQVYAAAYLPAYRVIAREFLPEQFTVPG